MKSLLVLMFVGLSSAFFVEFTQTFLGRATDVHVGPNSENITIVGSAPTQQSFTYNDPLYGVISATQMIEIPDRESYWHSFYSRVGAVSSEVGNITFGFFGSNYQAHRVHFVVDSFSSIDQWHDIRNGAGYASITYGEGFFKGADGRFSYLSTFDQANNQFVIRATGVFWAPMGPPAPVSSFPLFPSQDKKLHF